jgi:hypothetical protein
MAKAKGVPSLFVNGKSVPGQITTDPDVFDTVRRGAAGTEQIANAKKYFEQKLPDVYKASINAARTKARLLNDEGAYNTAEKFSEILTRKSSSQSEADRRRGMFRRFDNLFHANTMTIGGADHWADDPSARLAGRAHVSVNAHASYVTIPASLQAVRPVINYVPNGTEKEDRSIAANREKLFFRWWEEAEMDLVMEDAALYKSLYGDTAAKVYYDPVRQMPKIQVISSPENLYLGYGVSDYSRLDWALYCYGITPLAAMEEFGVDVIPAKEGDVFYPYVTKSNHNDPLATLYRDSFDRNFMRRQTDYERIQVEVYDYWYKEPRGKGKAPMVKNCVFVGTQLISESEHPEYDGEIPYVVLTNSRIPGSPYGKPELYDVEQLLREKDERITNQAQFIHQVVGGQMFQLIGQDAPEEVPANAIPKPGRIATPGAGNRIEPIQPFIPQMQLEDYNRRLDRELTVISGLNDLLLGVAPSGVLGSSRAIASLIANYEQRIAPKRKLFYQWIKNVWRLSAKVWENKNNEIKIIFDGQYRIEITPPELTPRDTLELASTAINLVQNRIWSAERAMDRVGVEDPQGEKDIIRDEQTDATINPAAVATMAQVIAQFQQMGVTPPQGAQQQGQAGMESAMNAMRTQNPPQQLAEGQNDQDLNAQGAAESQPSNAAGVAQDPQQLALMEQMAQQAPQGGLNG